MPLTDRNALLKLLTARHPCVSITTFEEDHAVDAVRQSARAQNRPLVVWDCVNGIQQGETYAMRTLPPRDQWGQETKAAKPDGDTTTAGGGLAYIESKAEPGVVAVCLDLAEHLEKDTSVARMFRLTVDRMARDNGTLVLVDHQEQPQIVQALATNLELSYPGEEELREIVKEIVRDEHRKRPVSVQLTKDELAAIVNNLRGLTRRQARRATLEAVVHDRKLSADDVESVLEHKRRSLSAGGLLQFVDAPTDLDQIGGLDKMKRWLKLRENALEEDASQYGIDPPRGLLLLGVQGAGKSLASKAVATAWKRPLLRMDVGALYDKYIGQSERQLREALRQAEMMSPCILWIDEIEKAFAGAASQSNDGGLSRRMFGALLTWMQEHREPVFLIATANDVSALPPELLRKGRFDEIFFVDLPDAAAREMIFGIHLRNRGRKLDAFDLRKLAKEADGFSGAEIEQAIVASLYTAYADRREMTQDDIVKALQTSPPLSVTRREHIEELRGWAKDRCVPAD